MQDVLEADGETRHRVAKTIMASSTADVRKQRLNDVRVKGADEIRSLTLVEEERLLGLPDGHTERENIPPGADAAHRERPAYTGSPLLHARGDASREDRSPTFGIQAATTQTCMQPSEMGEKKRNVASHRRRT